MADVLDRNAIKALASESRQDIMKMLARRPYTASEIAGITKKHVTTVTEHLDNLERANLVRKKPGKKWVYYELSEKGEHLFKPQFYSWVVVLSLSAVLMFVGLLRLTNIAYLGSGTMETASAPLMAEIAQKTTDAYATGTPVDYIAYALIIIGLAGLAYLAYKKFR